MLDSLWSHLKGHPLTFYPRIIFSRVDRSVSQAASGLKPGYSRSHHKCYLLIAISLTLIIIKRCLEITENFLFLSANDDQSALWVIISDPNWQMRIKLVVVQLILLGHSAFPINADLFSICTLPILKIKNKVAECRATSCPLPWFSHEVMTFSSVLQGANASCVSRRRGREADLTTCPAWLNVLGHWQPGTCCRKAWS